MDTYWDKRAREAKQAFGFEFKPDGDGCVCELGKDSHVRVNGGGETPLRGEVMDAGKVIADVSDCANVYAVHRAIGVSVLELVREYEAKSEKAAAEENAKKARAELKRKADEVAADPLAASDAVEAASKSRPKRKARGKSGK